MKYFYIILIFVSALNYTSCKVSSHYNTDELAGEYEYLFITNVGNEKIKLIIEKDGSYLHFLVSSSIYPGLCDSPSCISKGTWKIQGKNIILNSFLRSEKPEYYREEIKLYEYHHDSIQIEILNLSDGSPVKGEVLILYGEKNTILPVNFTKPIETNENGIAVFPIQSVEKIEYPMGKCIRGMYRIPPPKDGYYYRIYYQDCTPEIFKNAKFEIRGDTLIKQERILTSFTQNGKEVYNTFEYKYVKIK